MFGLLVSWALQGCLAYRLEGQIFDEQELAAASLHQESAEAAFSMSSTSHHGHQVQSANTTESDGEDQECKLAVIGSARKRRGNQCECPEGTQVKCVGEPCNKFGQRFRPKDVAELSCVCHMCDTRCESVPGARTRTSGWKRITGRDCECEKGFFLVGENANCKAKGKEKRFFKSKRVVDRDCYCTKDSDTQEEVGSEEGASNEPNRGLTPTEPTQPKEGGEEDQGGASDPPQDEQLIIDPTRPSSKVEDKKWYETQDVSKWLFSLFGIGLVCCCLTTVCRVFKAAMEAEDEDVVGTRTTDASVRGRPTETWTPYQRDIRSYDRSRDTASMGQEGSRGAGGRA